MQPAYVAGLLDGEGTISLQGPSPKHLSHGEQWWGYNVRITNSHLPTLRGIQNIYGGKIYLNDWKRFGKKPCYTLRFNGKEASELLRAIGPYVHIKKKQVEFLMWYLSVRRIPFRRLSDGTLMLRWGIKNAIHSENNRPYTL